MTNQVSERVVEEDAEEQDDSDVTAALMTALSSQDMGEPSVDLNLSLLTPTERRAVLNLLHKHLELGEAVRQVTHNEPTSVPDGAAR